MKHRVYFGAIGRHIDITEGCFYCACYYSDMVDYNRHAQTWKRKDKTRVRKRVFERDGNRCVRCGTEKDLVVDHVLSLRRGGSNDMSNLQTLCQTCNGKKSRSEDRAKWIFGKQCPECGTGR